MTTDGYVDYPLQLRPNLIVHLRLPLNLTKAEVHRLVAFLRTIAVSDDESNVAR